jgi:hypothetical protein
MEDVKNYFSELTVSLQDMYEQIADNTNGSIKSDAFVQRDQWTPTLNGFTTPGTFTYTHQTGWALRQGLITDVWFDVAWTAAGSATGSLFIELPYQVAVGSNKPFVGVCQPSAITYTGGTAMIVNAIPGTYRAELWNTGTSFTTETQAVVASGQVIGFVRYIGISNET